MHASQRILLAPLLLLLLVVPIRAAAQSTREGVALSTRRAAELALVFRAQTDPTAHALMLSLTVPLERVVVPQAQAVMHVRFQVDTKWVRQLVVAAWVTAGLGESDSGLASLRARARLSALLPEARVRVLRSDDARASYELVPDDASTHRGTQQAGYTWEGRLTWRLDRLLFAEEELGIERLGNERRESRDKLRHRVLEAYFVYRRAEADLRVAIEGSREAFESRLKLEEATTTLDALTAGFFSLHLPTMH